MFTEQLIEMVIVAILLISNSVLLGCFLVLNFQFFTARRTANKHRSDDIGRSQFIRIDNQKWLNKFPRFKKYLTRYQLKKDFSYPKVAIIVPFYNEPFANMKDTLTAIEQLNYPGEAVFYLVDDGSTNESTDKVKEWLYGPKKWEYQLKVLPVNTGMKGRVMDTVLPLIDDITEVIGVIDSDTCLEPEALTRTIEALYSSPTHAAACGFIVPTKADESLLHFAQYHEHIGMLASVKHAQNQFGLVNVMAGAFVLHKVEVVKELGGWGQWLVEDISWTYKAIASGYTMAYAHDGIAHTICPSTPSSLFNQRRRWSRGRIEALKVAWSISKTRTLAIVPWLIFYFQSSLLPTVILAPLAWLFDFGALAQFLIITNVLFLASLNIFTFLKFKKTLNLPWRNLPKSLLLSFFTDLLLMPANVAGMSDELRQKNKDWITRKAVL